MKEERIRLNIDLLSMSETLWVGNGKFCSHNMVFHLGGDQHVRGIGIMSEKTSKSFIVGRYPRE